MPLCHYKATAASHRQRGTGTESKLPLDTSWLITFPADITALTAVPASWGRVEFAQYWLCDIESCLCHWSRACLHIRFTSTNTVKCKMSLKLIRLCIWPIQKNKQTTSLESSFNRSDQLKWYCFHSPYSLFDPNSINPFTNEATWIGVILNQIII